ncbi:hypothetical protein C8R47DRAFT_1220011 [Mycena vitilis]|nr:hypothetical protein C8R47DRAFT_1220011 [Mycena vitilis]
MAQPRSRAHLRETGRAVTAYLLDSEVGWQSSQAGDTQAIDEYNKNTDFWNAPLTIRDSTEGSGSNMNVPGDSIGHSPSPEQMVGDIDGAVLAASCQDPVGTGPATPQPALRTRARLAEAGRKTWYSPHWGLRRRADSAPFLTRRVLRELRELRKAQDSLDREFAVHLSRMQDLVSLQRQVLQAISGLAGSEEDSKSNQGMVADEEEDPIGPWIPRSNLSFSFHATRRVSQVEAAIIGGQDVLGRPPCVSPDEWAKGRDSVY